MNRAHGDSVAADLLGTEFGFVWGETDGTTWLRNDDGDYKRVDPEFVDRLHELARSAHDRDAVTPEERTAVEVLGSQGYLRPEGEITRRETPADIRLWPRLGAFLLTGALFSTFVSLRWAEIRQAPGSIDVDPVTAVGLLAFVVVATGLHELGHYVVGRRYFDPEFRFELLNRVIPAVVTRTTDAWQCPRNVRIWLSLAGPFVDGVVATVLAGAFVLYPEQRLLAALAVLLALRVVFVLNPLVEGDGYWLFVDLFGLHNLRSRGFRDLRAARSSWPAAYAVLVVVFTVCVIVTMLGIVAVNVFGVLTVNDLEILAATIPGAV